MDLFSHRNVSGLTQKAFEKLLAQLGADRERAGEEYEVIRRKLVKFFEWRGSVFPEDNADQVINRVARRIDEGEEIRDLKNYVYGVARMLFLETLKKQDKETAALENLPQSRIDSEEADEPESRLECLEMCLRTLTAENRELIIQYYRKERGAKIENRRAMALGMGIQLNALRIRAHRIKTKMEECISDCLIQVR